MITFRMEIDGLKKSATRVDKNTKLEIPYFIYVAYCTLPGYKHPQAVEFYTEKQYQVGTLLQVPVIAEVKDQKPCFTPDYRNSTVLPAPQAARAS